MSCSSSSAWVSRVASSVPRTTAPIGGYANGGSGIREEGSLLRGLAEYRRLLPIALDGGSQAELLLFLHSEGHKHRRATSASSRQQQPSRLAVKQTTLRRLWESRSMQLDRAAPDDWLEWMRHLSVALLRLRLRGERRMKDSVCVCCCKTSKG